MSRKKPKAKGRARRGRTNAEIEADIETQLREFLAGREVWPSYREFVAAGRRPLGRWQQRLGLRAPRRTYPGARATRHGSRS